MSKLLRMCAAVALAGGPLRPLRDPRVRRPAAHRCHLRRQVLPGLRQLRRLLEGPAYRLRRRFDARIDVRRLPGRAVEIGPRL